MSIGPKARRQCTRLSRRSMQKTPWFLVGQADVILNYLPLKNVLTQNIKATVKNKDLPDSAAHPSPPPAPPQSGLSLFLSLSPSQTWPHQGWSYVSSLADAVHPEGAPWILPRLDPSTQPGIEPETLHQMGTVLTTGMPGKSLKYWFYYHLGAANRSGDDCQLKTLAYVTLTDSKKRGHATFFWGGVAKQGNTGISKEESESRSVVSNSFQPRGLQSPWNSPGQNTGVGSCSLLQGIFPTQGSNPGLLCYRRILYQLNHQGSPRKLEWLTYPFSGGSSRPRNQTEEARVRIKSGTESLLWFPQEGTGKTGQAG